MFWWALLGYVLLSPVLGLLVGTAIRLQDLPPRSSRQKSARATEPCSSRAQVAGRVTVAAGR
jgi:multisubunit Na+/H+ antiporter MnhG subunit